jgi:uncharacterized protein YecT (DUF1311 family)
MVHELRGGPARLLLVALACYLVLGFALSSSEAVGASDVPKDWSVRDLPFNGGMTDAMAMSAEYHRADAKLNEVYKRVLHEYYRQTLFCNRLRDAENAWIEFRDAQVASELPDAKGDFYAIQGPYGTSGVHLYWSQMAELTWQRVIQLNQWVVATEGWPGSYGMR